MSVLATQTVIVQGLWATNMLLSFILAALLVIAVMCWEGRHRK